MNHRDAPFPTHPLASLARGEGGIVFRVEYQRENDGIAQRLEALGFVAGEIVRVVATGPFRREPIVVLVGSARFALRCAEAARVLMHAPQARG